MAETWVEEWQRGPWQRDEEAIAWMRSRPKSVRSLMLCFPPSCLVTANRLLRCPAPGQIAIVSSYIEPGGKNPEGIVTVRNGPNGDRRYHCEPAWLLVVGYYKGLTPEVVSGLLGGN